MKTYALLTVLELTACFLLKHAAVKEMILCDIMFMYFFEVFTNTPAILLNKFVVYGSDDLLW